MEENLQLKNHLSAVQSLLSGRDHTTIDKKGRLMLPKSVRDAVGTNFVLLVGRKGCLEVTSNQYYVELWAEIKKYSAHSDYRRDYALEVIGNSHPGIEAEESGRFVIPSDLCSYCKIPKPGKVVIIGAGDVAEIWSAEEYKKYQEDPSGYNRARRDKIAGLRKAMIEEGDLV